MQNKIPDNIKNFSKEDIQLQFIMNLPQLCNKKASFEDLQDGYRFNSVSQENLVNSGIWKESWFVIAKNYFADPFIIDVNEKGYLIYFAFHGQGTWELEKIANSFDELKSMLKQIATLNEQGLTKDILNKIKLSKYKDSEFWQETIEALKS